MRGPAWQLGIWAPHAVNAPGTTCQLPRRRGLRRLRCARGTRGGTHTDVIAGRRPIPVPRALAPRRGAPSRRRASARASRARRRSIESLEWGTGRTPQRASKRRSSPMAQRTCLPHTQSVALPAPRLAGSVAGLLTTSVVALAAAGAAGLFLAAAAPDAAAQGRGGGAGTGGGAAAPSTSGIGRPVGGGGASSRSLSGTGTFGTGAPSTTGGLGGVGQTPGTGATGPAGSSAAPGAGTVTPGAAAPAPRAAPVAPLSPPTTSNFLSGGGTVTVPGGGATGSGTGGGTATFPGGGGSAPGSTATFPGGGGSPPASASPSESAPSTPGGGGDSFEACMGFWEVATHMTKQEWGTACRRIMNRLQNLDLKVETGVSPSQPRATRPRGRGKR
jgi:hypothetical protein